MNQNEIEINPARDAKSVIVREKAGHFSETRPRSISELEDLRRAARAVFFAVYGAGRPFLSERRLCFAVPEGIRTSAYAVLFPTPSSHLLCSPFPMSAAVEATSTDVFEFHSQHGALPYIPDDLTVVQFFLDSYHPNRPSCHPPLTSSSSSSSSPNLRPDVGLAKDGRNWIVDDDSGRGFTHDQVRRKRAALR
jgi:hypothetical protein